MEEVPDGINGEKFETISQDTFHLKMLQDRPMVDVPFMVVFLVNVVIVCILQGSVFFRHITAVLSTSLSRNMLITLGVPVGVAIILLVVVLVIMLACPLAYITVCYVMASFCLVLSGISFVTFNRTYGYIVLFGIAIVPVVLLIVGRKQIKPSGLMCQEAASIMMKNPGAFGFLVVTMIPSILITNAHSAAASYISLTKLSGWYYVYLGLSFFWLNEFILYLGYFVFSGLTFADYFLRGTVRYPGSPLLTFVRHAFRSSFGSIALAALLTPYLVIMRIIPPKWICCTNTKFSELGLVYSAAYGYSLSEGTSRYDELRRTMRLDSFIYKSMVNMSGFFISMSLAFGGAVVGFFVSRQLTNDSEIPSVVSVFSASLVYFTSRLFTTSVGTITDALYILFGGAPSRMRTSHPTLCQSLLRVQRDELNSL